MVLMPDILSATWKIVVPAIPGVMFALLVACTSIFSSKSSLDVGRDSGLLEGMQNDFPPF
jgi:hypothetical protein